MISNLGTKHFQIPTNNKIQLSPKISEKNNGVHVQLSPAVMQSQSSGPVMTASCGQRPVPTGRVTEQCDVVFHINIMFTRCVVGYCPLMLDWVRVRVHAWIFYRKVSMKLALLRSTFTNAKFFNGSREPSQKVSII